MKKVLLFILCIDVVFAGVAFDGAINKHNKGQHTEALSQYIDICKGVIKEEKIEYLAYLDDDVWSLKFKNNKQIYTVGIKNILNHQLYVVIQFKQSEQKPIVIWFDQLNRTQWKNLKVLSVLK